MWSLTYQVLVAVPALQDPDFSRAVTLVCQHDDDGAMGVVINRASEYTLGDVFEQMGIALLDRRLHDLPVLTGGPVHPERGFVIHDGEGGWDSSLAIAEGLFVTTSRDVLEAMAVGEGPENAVVALGCAGWGAGQLEQELTQTSWLTVPADPQLLFDTPLDERWQAAAGRIGVDMMHVASHSGRA
ncbi:YqgE/AlgH family protein [Luteimonas deserti]|uniref:UPF0301 protein H0E82_12815 n=1 Tax=Luteimonas deserti TaxID=2752306 RepID=A0A7Z0QTF7_9GAMM|nr:YqgE/AlgH family protein [Luteimonas deserti]NYZ63631.1 YqgE/AlgH family protein [Luteimonas deserti]